MTKLQRALLATFLAFSVSLGGCMGQKEPERAPEKKEQQGKNQGDAKEKDPIETGAGKMQKRLAEYARIEGSLNKILVAVQVVPLNNKLVSAEIDRLDAGLDELKETKGERPKPEKVDMKTGGAAMRHGLAELSSATDAGDTARMQGH